MPWASDCGHPWSEPAAGPEWVGTSGRAPRGLRHLQIPIPGGKLSITPRPRCPRSLRHPRAPSLLIGASPGLAGQSCPGNPSPSRTVSPS